MQTPFSDFYNYVKHFLEIVNVCLGHFIQQSSDSHKKGEKKASFPSHLRCFCISVFEEIIFLRPLLQGHALFLLCLHLENG